MKEKQGLKFVDCKEPELSGLLPFYLNGDVTSKERQEIEKHVGGCVECQRKLSFVMTLSQVGLPAWRARK